MSARAAAKAAAKQARKLRQKAKRTPVIAQQAAHPLESAQLMSNVASQAYAEAPSAASTAAPTVAPTTAPTTAEPIAAPASEQDASAKAKHGTAALPKCTQISIQNAADATVTVSICKSDQPPVPCTDSMLTCCCQPARVPCAHQPAWASTSCTSAKPQTLTEQTRSLFLDGQRPAAAKVPAANKLFCCPITKVTFPLCLMRLLVALMPAMTSLSSIVFSCCRLVQSLLCTRLFTLMLLGKMLYM